jgi:hypothetical protein
MHACCFKFGMATPRPRLLFVAVAAIAQFSGCTQLGRLLWLHCRCTNAAFTMHVTVVDQQGRPALFTGRRAADDEGRQPGLPGWLLAGTSGDRGAVWHSLSLQCSTHAWRQGVGVGAPPC